MAVLAKSIIRRVVDLLQDAGASGWSTAELVRWLNDGQREVVVYRPDACTTAAAIPLAAGVRQSLPATAHKLIDIRCNTTGLKSAVTLVNRTELDDINPSWRSMASTTEIAHFMYDQRDPRSFDVYPPAAAGASLDAICASFPVDIAEPADGATWADVAGSIGVGDLFANALVDYVMHRAYSKDDNEAGNAARAVAHYQAFTNALGAEATGTATATPAERG